MAYAWGSLLSAVRTGAPAYHTVFGRPFWEDLQAHPEVAASFDALMGPAGHGTPDPEVLVSGGWDSVRTVVDVGGGTGALLAAILRARPTVRGTLVDLPRTVARSGEVFQAAGVADREATTILRRCAESARPAGRVVVLNGVSPDSDEGPSPDLLMMVLVGGKERSLSEFRELARAAGLEVHAAERQPSGRFVVECRPT
jgi:2,7-dihydroxy-5-methyl-1-naphthoate 7-O-methyltransferase